MKKTLMALFLLSGCSSAPTEEDTKSLLETLEWDEGECGSLVISGEVSAGTSVIPWFQSKMHLNHSKEKPCDVQRSDTENP